MLDQSFLLELCEHRERFSNRARNGTVESPDTQVDNIEHIESEVFQVVVDGLAQLLRSKCLRPVSLGISQRSDLSHDVQSLRIRVQSFLDYLVGNVWTIEI